MIFVLQKFLSKPSVKRGPAPPHPNSKCGFKRGNLPKTFLSKRFSQKFLSSVKRGPAPPHPNSKCGFKRGNLPKTFLSKGFSQNDSLKTILSKRISQNLLAPKPLTISINPKPLNPKPSSLFIPARLRSQPASPPPPPPKHYPRKTTAQNSVKTFRSKLSVKTFGQNVIGTQTLNNFYKP